jgi:hypothetical protein
MIDHDNLFGNEAFLPSQFYAGRGERLNEPIKRLALAVLEDAIRIFQRRPHSPPGREARYWLFEVGHGPFSFAGVCEMLGIDAGYLRTGIKVWEGDLSRRLPVNGNGGPRITASRSRRRKSAVR